MKFVLLAALLLALPAAAQEPDIQITRTAGTYNVGCGLSEPDPSVVAACFVRADASPPDELGCTGLVNLAGEYRLDVVVPQTTFDDAELRCYLLDAGTPQLASLYSDNKGDIDFTPPAKGHFK